MACSARFGEEILTRRRLGAVASRRGDGVEAGWAGRNCDGCFLVLTALRVEVERSAVVWAAGFLVAV